MPPIAFDHGVVVLPISMKLGLSISSNRGGLSYFQQVRTRINHHISQLRQLQSRRTLQILLSRFFTNGKNIRQLLNNANLRNLIQFLKRYLANQRHTIKPQ